VSVFDGVPTWAVRFVAGTCLANVASWFALFAHWYPAGGTAWWIARIVFTASTLIVICSIGLAITHVIVTRGRR